MITERFLNFVKTEFADFWQKTAQKTANETEQWLFEQVYSYFLGKEKITTTAQERAQAYLQFKRIRQNSFTQKTPTSLEVAYYNALELPVDSSWEDIKSAYKSTMKKYHPDRFAHDAEKQKIAQTLAQKINEAYQYFKIRNSNAPEPCLPTQE